MPPASPDRRAPFFTCSPWALLVLVLFVTLWLAWREFGERLIHPNAPEAQPRTVTPRGDLAADEQSTIALFEHSKDSVVHITTWERRQVRFRLRSAEYPAGEGT